MNFSQITNIWNLENTRPETVNKISTGIRLSSPEQLMIERTFHRPADYITDLRLNENVT